MGEPSAIVWSIGGIVIAGFAVNLLLDFLDKGKLKYFVEKVVYALVISVSTVTIIRGINSIYSIMDAIK